MLSITEMKKRLPEEFMESLYEMFSPIIVDKILIGMNTKREATLRVNTIKYDRQNLMRLFKEKNIKFERVSWYEDAFILKNTEEKEIQKLSIYEKGNIYFQSLSSMLPALVLNPKQGEKVLDLTAAPGSKTTQMAAKMNNKGSIFANELDAIRCERLKYNVQKQGATIVTISNNRGERIGESYQEQFDKVLLDTPCSGEGRFIANRSATYRDWSRKRVNQLTKIQKKLIQSAYQALKKNGKMVYSTCTLNKQENEEILNWAIQNLNLKLLDIQLPLKEAIPAFEEGMDNSIQKAIRILPSKKMEGFFVAKLEKY